MQRVSCDGHRFALHVALGQHVARRGSMAVSEKDTPMKRTLISTVVALLLLPAPARAQTSHLDIVRAIKKEVLAKGIDLDMPPGECGRYQITKRVIWWFRDEGAGSIRKAPEQNNCDGHGVDIVMYKDGTIVDILGGGNEGRDTPQWNVLAPVDPALWLAPVDPGDTPAAIPPPQPPSPPPPPIVTVDLAPVLAKLDAIAAKIDALPTKTAEQAEDVKRFDQQEAEKTREQVRVVAHDFGDMFKNGLEFVAKYIAPAIAGIWAGHAMAK